MAIGALLDEIEKHLLVGYPKLQLARGVKAIEQHGSPPRVTWVITGGAHSPAEKVGKPKSLLTRDLNLIAHVWAADVDALDELVNDTLVALHRVCHGSYRPLGEDWIPDDVSHQGAVALVRVVVSGAVLERRFKVEPRVPDQQITHATITAIAPDTSTSSQGDGNLDWSEDDA